MKNTIDDTCAITQAPKGSGLKALILTADKAQDLEFFYPYYRLTEAGFTVDVATPQGGVVTCKHELMLKKTKALQDIDPAAYALLYIPGGQAPEELRKNEDALSLVTRFAATGRPLAAICHGTLVLVAAGLARGRRMTGWLEIEDEIRAAGATFLNEPCVIDGQFITARMPGDLPMHLSQVLAQMEQQQSQAA